MSMSIMQKKIVCYLEGQGHNEGLYDQTRTLSTIAFELQFLWQPDLVWWYIIISQSVFWKKQTNPNWIDALKIMVTAKVQNVNEWLSRSYPAKLLLSNLVLWCSIISQSILQKKRKKFAIFKVKVTARARVIKIWLFLLLSSKLLVCLQPNLV